ncbi:hypothetical protein BU16DRAFT_42568 [Lophium mytilinum]|uniref:Uncharacterized protein n=1 Tax=Lophium mytilinum TaxID=390894 RepID=A0A6A6QQV8_9PEZI|nr:hypothetical protein BU16DRAFT_42568 [Lophium mytilinum]
MRALVGVARRGFPGSAPPSCPVCPARHLFWRLPATDDLQHHTTPRRYHTRLQEPALRALAILCLSPQLHLTIAYSGGFRGPPLQIHSPELGPSSPAALPSITQASAPRVALSPPDARPISAPRIRCMLPVHVRSAAVSMSCPKKPCCSACLLWLGHNLSTHSTRV